MATIFDAPTYLELKTQLYNSTHDPDVSVDEMVQLMADAGFTPLAHYRAFGEQELANAGIQFDPFVQFNEQAYLEAKTQLYNSTHDPDVSVDEMVQLMADAGFTPLAHYRAFGKEELRDAGITFPDAAGDDTNGNGGNNDAGPGETFDLSAGTKTLEGTDGNDIFNANTGTVTGSYGSVDGNGGDDTLNANINIGTNPFLSLTPQTEDVENINLTAYGLGGSTVFVDAREMNGVDTFNSVYSTANVFIKSVQAGPDNMSTREMHIGMDHTSADDSHWDASNMTVLFDQDDLTTHVEQQGYFFRILNRHREDFNNYDEAAAEAKPVEGLQEFSVEVVLGGTTYTVSLSDKELNGLETVDQMVDLLNQEVAQDEDIPDAIQFKLGQDWTDIHITRATQPQVIVASTGDEPVTGGDITAALTSEDGDLVFTQNPRDSLTVPVSINVDLTKVGQSGEGGGLKIGSMNKAGINVLSQFTEVDTINKTVPGIQTFNVTVHGPQALSSSLAYLQSTNNVLQKVTIDSQRDANSGGWADLYIGNSNTGVAFGTADANAQALKDVATLNASAFKGDLTVHAGLTNEFIAKYAVSADFTHHVSGVGKAGEVDDASAADNQQVNYTGGSGNDTIDLAVVSGFAGEDGGAPLSNLEHASYLVDGGVDLQVSGGAGGDTIDVNGGSFINSVNTANWNVNGGAGDDTITVGNGHNVINGGAGNDTINLASFRDGAWGDTIVFTGSNTGHDTVTNFTAGKNTDASVQFEVQTFDLSNYTLGKGERVELTVDGKTISYVNDTGSELRGADLAAAIAGLNTADLDNAGSSYGLTTGGSTGSILTVTQNGVAQNIGTSTLSGGLDEWTPGGDNNVTVNAVTVDNGVSANQINDVLDFSSYNLDALLIGDRSGNGANLILGEETLMVNPNGPNTLSNGDTYISLVELDNPNGQDSGIFQIETHTVTSDTSDHDAASVIGTVDLGVDDASLVAANIMIG